MFITAFFLLLFLTSIVVIIGAIGALFNVDEWLTAASIITFGYIAAVALLWSFNHLLGYFHELFN